MSKKPPQEKKGKLFDEFNANRQKAIKACLDPGCETVQDVAEACDLHVNTVLSYLSEDDFVAVIVNARKALENPW